MQTLFDQIIALRDEQRAQRSDGVVIVRGADLPQEQNALGLMRWYMHPALARNVLSTMLFYQQELPPGSRSGRLRFQGGQVMYVLEGRGHTLLDGERHPWEAGDVLNLPLRKNGVVVQHFNDDAERPARFLACEPNLLECTGVDRGCGFEVLENAPAARSAG